MATDAELVAKYREKAKDKTLPQEVKNMYLDKAVELEQKAYKKEKPTSLGPKMAKGGAVSKMSNSKMMKDSAMAKNGAKMPAIAIMIGVAKPKPKAKAATPKRKK
jgi:hypothetical protein